MSCPLAQIVPQPELSCPLYSPDINEGAFVDLVAREGRRPEFPIIAPVAFRELAARCWAQEAESRCVVMVRDDSGLPMVTLFQTCGPGPALTAATPPLAGPHLMRCLASSGRSVAGRRGPSPAG